MTDATLHLDPVEAARRAPSQPMAERMGALVWALELVETIDLTPSMRRLRFHVETPESLAYLPGNDLTLAIAYRDDAVVRRRYTIRAVDVDRRTLDLDFVLHGDGPAGRWAATVRPGAHVEGIGPRGKISIVSDVAWHLFAGDDAYLPATSSMVGALPAGTSASVFLEVDSPVDVQDLPSRATLDGPHYLYRNGTPPGESRVLVEALRSLELPAGHGFAYLGGEHHIVSEIRQILIDKGMPAEHMAPKSYWRLGRANADHGEPSRDD